MRIVITSNYKLNNETGTAHVAQTLSTYLSKRNDVIYICLGNKFETIFKNKGLNIIKVPSIEINNVDVPLITPDVIIKIFGILNKFKPDIIHSQNPLFISNLVQTWANLNEIPFVVTFHHIPTEAVEHVFPKLSKNILSKLVQDLYKDISLKSFLKKTDLVIALNKFVYDSVKKIDNSVPMKILNNGLDLNKLLKIKRKKIFEKRINFVFVGSYNERKNQEFLIKSFSKLPDNFLLNLYGNKKTGKNYVDKLNTLKEKLKLKNVFINNYSKNIESIYKKTNFFISTSLKEAQSLSVIEALASGIPVIGLKNETTMELVNVKTGKLLPKNISSKKFAQEIISFVKSCNYKVLSRKSRNSVLKFKIQNVVSKMEKVYKTTTYSNSQNSRGNVSKYYQEIFKSIIVQK